VTEFVSAQEDTGTLPALKEAAEVQPCDPLILARLARVEPDVQTAAFYVRLAMARAPDSAQVCQLAALALDRLGDGRAAADEIEKAVRLAPAQPEYRSAQGDILWRAGDQSGALSALDAAIQADPKNPAYLADRGLKRAIGGDNAGASSDLEAALAAAPSTPEVRNECGWTLMQLGDFGRAADQFKAASTLGLPGLAACAWHVDLKEQAVATYLALIKYDNAYGGAGYLSAKLSALGLPRGDLDLLETVRASTLEKYPEFKK
jgi:Flp pilus assembly protein TadD